jgi:hypothetical protein
VPSPREIGDPEKWLQHLERCYIRNGLESKLKQTDASGSVRPLPTRPHPEFNSLPLPAARPIFIVACACFPRA